jgi:hypothetical protein
MNGRTGFGHLPHFAMCLSFIFVGTITAPLAFAADNQAAPPVATHPTLPGSIVSYFAGKWDGTGTLTRTGASLASTSEMEAVDDGGALLIRHAEKPPATSNFTALMSMDSNSGDVVLLMTTNRDSGARLFRSPGWQGDSIQFTADKNLHAWFASERITFTRLTPTSYHAQYEMSRDNGQTWRTGDEQTFTKE